MKGGRGEGCPGAPVNGGQEQERTFKVHAPTGPREQKHNQTTRVSGHVTGPINLFYSLFRFWADRKLRVHGDKSKKYSHDAAMSHINPQQPVWRALRYPDFPLLLFVE